MNDEKVEATTEEVEAEVEQKKYRLQTIVSDQDIMTLRKVSVSVPWMLGDNSGRGYLDKDTIELIQALKDHILEHDGLGMSAIQLGIDKRVFVMRKPFNSERLITIINPTLVRGTGQSIKTENCFSIPNLPGEVSGARVRRWSHIFVNYRTEEDKVYTEEMFVGMDARVFLHELDHLNGELILDDHTANGTFMGWDRLLK